MNNHQRVIMTRWWLLPPSALNSTQYNLHPSSNTLDPSQKKSTNESQRLVGGFLPPSALNFDQYKPHPSPFILDPAKKTTNESS